MSVVVLAGVLAGGAASAALAEPAAEVGPAQAEPGGSVTVSVTCDPVGGSPPATLEAASQAFEDGLAELSLVGGQDGKTSGPAYRGTATIVLPEDSGAGAAHAGGEGSAWTVDGTCPAAHGEEGKPWSATFTVAQGGGQGQGIQGGHSASASPAQGGGQGQGIQGGHSASASPTQGGGQGQGLQGGHSASPCPDPKDTGCGTAVVQRGVRAGEGGAFGVSVPALVLGGLLIAGALGAAAHRLYGRLFGADG
ncbi:hypothetical protein ACFWHW_24725 [Streptomyces pharetrae]|uniref:hypothetical protein n=1 Tax=Streptomyces pharetrae TaxID=291370 RepID=UPI003653EF1A